MRVKVAVPDRIKGITWIGPSFLLAFIFIIYSPSLDVPFYLDDYDSIIVNSFIQTDSLFQLWESHYRQRFIGYATIWLNFQFDGLNPKWYHAGNIALHAVCSLLVFWFSRLVLNYFDGAKNTCPKTQEQYLYWALALAFVWALHPLNSQVVIYVVQRLSALSALFMLVTAIAYIKLRRADTMSVSFNWLVLLVVAITCGLFSKQNYLTIFAFLYCWELFSCNNIIRWRIIKVTAIALLATAFLGPFLKDYWLLIDQFTRDPGATNRVTYFYTQTIVLWDYIFRFFYPINLQLNIFVEPKESLEPIVALAILAHAALLLIAYRLRKIIPLLFVGILFFYTSHLVESFIIPIKDLAFEHRTYVGNIGLCIALVGVSKFVYETYFCNYSKKHVLLIGLCIPLMVIISFHSYHRTNQWIDPLVFYALEVERAPEHYRTNASYGNELLKLQRFEEAEKYLRKSIKISAKNNTMSAGTINAYMTLMYQQRKYQQAAPIVMLGLKHIRNPVSRSLLLSNLAVGYIYMGFCDFALGLLNQAITLNSANADAHKNKAYCEQVQRTQ